MDLEYTRKGEFARVDTTVGSDLSDVRLQDALVGLFPQLLPSRKSCKKAIERGHVLINGKEASTARRVRPGDIVSYRPAQKPLPKMGAGAPRDILVIRPTNSDYVLAWKPPGLATSGSGALNFARILTAQMQSGTPEQRQELTPNQPGLGDTPLPVHRLDRATSGWVCVALNLSAAQTLGHAFETRTVKKRYLALVAGELTQPGSQRQNLDGKSAITHWYPLASGPMPVHGTATLLEVDIETGRTHQIRRHLAAIGHPIVGENQHVPDQGGRPALRYTGHGLFLSAVQLSIPEGQHGPAHDVEAGPPKKFIRIRWVRDHFAHPMPPKSDRAQATEAS